MVKVRVGGGSQMRGLRILIACFRAPGTRLTVSLSRHVMKHPSAHRLSLASWGYTLVKVCQTLQLQLLELERWKWKVISLHLKIISHPDDRPGKIKTRDHAWPPIQDTFSVVLTTYIIFFICTLEISILNEFYLNLVFFYTMLPYFDVLFALLDKSHLYSYLLKFG